MSDLTAICDGCHSEVLGDTGWLGVRYADIQRYYRDLAEWHEAHPGEVHTVHELMAQPDEITWRVYHDQCDPWPEQDGYQIDVERIRSWQDLARWTSDLMAKNWLADSDWDGLLRELADSKGTRLVAVKERAA
jgi:hypothetical protein